MLPQCVARLLVEAPRASSFPLPGNPPLPDLNQGSRMTFRSARNLCLVAILFLSPSVAVAQNAETLFLEGMSAFRKGDHQVALENFRAVVRLDPSRVEAVRLMAESQDALVQLMLAGGEFEAFALEVLESAAARDRETRRDSSAAAEDAAACLSGDYSDRAKAIFQLGRTYGPFGVPPLVDALGGTEDRALSAVYALSRLGSDSLIPLLAATQADSAVVRRGVVQALLQMGDLRASARLTDMATSDRDGSVRVLAAAGASSAGAAQACFDQGMAFYLRNPASGLTEGENHGVIWKVSGSSLEAMEVSPALVHLELGKSYLGRAHALGHPRSGAGLALVYSAAAAVLTDLGDEDGSTMQAAAALTLGPASLSAALDAAMELGRLPESLVLVDLLASSGDSGLLPATALRSTTPSIRFQAAIALAHFGHDSNEVVRSLGDAISIEVHRAVVIVDANDARAQGLARNLQDEGSSVIVATSGLEGLSILLQGLPLDAVVVAEGLPDFYAKRMVREIRRLDRYSDMPVLVLGNDSTGVIDGAEVTNNISVADVQASFQDLGSGRQRAEDAAAAAAEALLEVARRDPNAAAVAALQLAGVLNRDDAVAVPAMKALGFCGSSAPASALLAVVADESRSSAARAAGAYALAGLFARGATVVNSEAVLQAGMQSGDAAVMAGCASALGRLPGRTAHTLVPIGG